MRTFLNWNIESIIVVLLFTHILIGSIRGLNKLLVIEKYQSNYYANDHMSFFNKMVHNWLSSTFSLITLFLSASFTIMLFLIFNA
ncbi:hypothetical protein ACJD0Z_08325 [Flavobacteriaceae bacterium M23B6Z8]